MMSLQRFFNNFIKDVSVELKDEFDQNFSRKAFFDEKWPLEKLLNRRGSLMARTNKLRSSIQDELLNDGIRYTSSLPYASIHNEGGHIVVTAKMKSFFWYMYYKTSGKLSKNSRNRHLSIEAQQWKNLALMKVGQKIEIPKRRFIGDHPRVTECVRSVLDDSLKELDINIRNNFTQ